MGWAPLNLSSSFLWLAVPTFYTISLSVGTPRSGLQHISQPSVFVQGWLREQRGRLPKARHVGLEPEGK